MDQETIGKFISSCRKDKGLTQMQLAEKLNIYDLVSDALLIKIVHI